MAATTPTFSKSFFHELDPLALDIKPQDKAYLIDLLAQNPTQYFYDTNKIYWLQKTHNNTQWEVPIKLRHPIIRLRLSAGAQDNHITVVKPPFGHGGDSMVSEVEIEADLNQSPVEYRLVPSSFVAKIQHIAHQNKQRKGVATYIAKKEAHIGAQLPHLQTKLIINKDEHLISIMKNLGKTELFSILESDCTYAMPFTQRLNLALAILRAYKSQVSDRGLVHFDVKPENIMVLGQNAYFVDYADTYDLANKQTRLLSPGGSINYRAPELLRRPIEALTNQADIFSLGRVLTLLFRPHKMEDFHCASNVNLHRQLNLACTRDERNNYKEKFPALWDSQLPHHNQSRLEAAWEFILEKQHPLNIPLFKDIEDEASPTLRDEIHSLISQMVSYSAETRPNIDTLIKAFEQINLRYRSESTTTKSQSSIYSKQPKDVFFQTAPTGTRTQQHEITPVNQTHTVMHPIPAKQLITSTP